MVKLKRLVLCCLCFVVTFLLVACTKETVKITKTDEETTVYINSEIDLTNYFKIEVNNEEVPVTIDMIQGTVDTTKIGKYTITCQYTYNDKVHELSVTIEVVEREVEIKQTNEETTILQNSASIDVTKYFQIIVKGEIVPTTLDMIQGTVDTTKIGTYEIVCTYEYQEKTYQLSVTIEVVKQENDEVVVTGNDVQFYVEENITNEQLIQLLKSSFQIKVNDKEIPVEESMLDYSSVHQDVAGVYSAKLTYVHQQSTYTKTIQVIVIDGLTPLRTALVQPWNNYTIQIEHNGVQLYSFYKNLVKTTENGEVIYYGYDRIEQDYYKLVPYKEQYRRTNIDDGELYRYYTSIITNLNADDFEIISEGKYKVKDESIPTVLKNLLNLDGSSFNNISIELELNQIIQKVKISYQENGNTQNYVISVIDYNDSQFEVEIVEIDFNDFLPTLDDESNQRANISEEGIKQAFAKTYDNVKITGSIDLINRYDHDYTELEYIKTPTVCQSSYNGFTYIRTWDEIAHAYLTVPTVDPENNYDFYTEDELERYLLSIELTNLLKLNANYFEVGENGYFVPIEGYDLAILYVIFGHFFYYVTGIDFGQIPETNISCEGLKLKVVGTNFYHISGRFKYVDETGEELYATMKFELRDFDQCSLEMPDTSYVSEFDRAFAYLGYYNQFGLTYQSTKAGQNYSIDMDVQDGIIQYKFGRYPSYLYSQYIQYNSSLYRIFVRQFVNDYGYWDEEYTLNSVYQLKLPTLQMSFKFANQDGELIRYSEAFEYNSTSHLYVCKEAYLDLVMNALIDGYIVTGDLSVERFGSIQSILLSIQDNRVRYIEFKGKDVDGVKDLSVQLSFKSIHSFDVPALYTHCQGIVPGLDSQSETESDTDLADLQKAFDTPMDNVAINYYEAYNTTVSGTDDDSSEYERSRYYFEVCGNEIYSYNPANGDTVVSYYVPNMNLYYVLNLDWIDVGFHTVMTPSIAQQYRYAINTDFSPYHSEDFEVTEDGYFTPKARYKYQFATSFFGELGYYDFFRIEVPDVKIKVVDQRIEYIGVRFNQIFDMGGTYILSQWQVEYFFSDYGEMEDYGLQALVDPLDLALYERKNEGFYTMNYTVTCDDTSETIQIYVDDYISGDEISPFRLYVLPNGKKYYLSSGGFITGVDGTYQIIEEFFEDIPLPYQYLFNHEVMSNTDVFMSMFFSYDERTGCYEAIPDMKVALFQVFNVGYIVYQGQAIELTDEELFYRFAFRLDEEGHLVEMIVEYDNYQLDITYGEGEIFTIPQVGSKDEEATRPNLEDLNEEVGTTDEQALEAALQELFDNYTYRLQCYADSPSGKEIYTVTYTIEGNVAKVDITNLGIVTTYYLEYLGKIDGEDMFHVYSKGQDDQWTVEEGTLDELLETTLLDYFDVKTIQMEMLEAGEDGYFNVKEEYRERLFCDMFGYDYMPDLLTYDVYTFKVKIVNNKITSVIVSVHAKARAMYQFSYYVCYSIELTGYGESDYTLPTIEPTEN